LEENYLIKKFKKIFEIINKTKKMFKNKKMFENGKKNKKWDKEFKKEKNNKFFCLFKKRGKPSCAPLHRPNAMLCSPRSPVCSVCGSGRPGS
jgi:hypothetical protein